MVRFGPSARAQAPVQISLLLVAALTLSSCGGVAARCPATPEEAARAYVQAVKANRYEEAYGLLSAQARADLPYERFLLQIKQQTGSQDGLERALSGDSAVLDVTAQITTPGGDTVELVLQDGQWRLAPAAVDYYAQSTPLDAARTLVRAWKAGRFDVLPKEQQAGATAESLRTAWLGEQKDYVAGVIAAAELALPQPELKQQGERATLVLGTSGLLVLLREDGVWKIEDITR
jgi:uncharacterized protein YceK